MLTKEELDLYEIAFLLRMPVYKILEEMPFEELQKWHEYFEARPFGWREDRRTALVMGSFGGKIDVNKIFPSLAALSKTASDNPISSLPGSALFSKLLGAKGGDTLQVLQELK